MADDLPERSQPRLDRHPVMSVDGGARALVRTQQTRPCRAVRTVPARHPLTAVPTRGTGTGGADPDAGTTLPADLRADNAVTRPLPHLSVCCVEQPTSPTPT